MDDLSWGGFKTLESGLGLSGGTSSSSFWDSGFGKSLSSAGSSISNGFGAISDNFSKNKYMYNFLGNGALGVGNYMMQSDAAKEAKKMNSYYMSQFDREKKRQEDAEKAMQFGFANSGLGA